MLIYRFRITSADQEDFIREIEIQPTQTFLDFHDIIISCSDLNGCQNAMFFNTDKKYKPHQQISLKQQKKQVKKYDEELDEIIIETAALNLMKDSQLKKFIEDPHQKMIYEFTGKDFFVFNIELFKIIKTEENFLLPRCIRKVGELPKKIEIPVAPTEQIIEEKELFPLPLIPVVTGNIFKEMQEDESEIADIENHLSDFLDLDETDNEVESPDVKVPLEDLYGAEEETEDDGMDSLEDYEDLENLEIGNRNFDHDSDEF